MNEQQLPDLMTVPTLQISADPDNLDVFRIHGGTYVHKDLIATIPGSRFVGKGRDYWTIPKAWTSLKVLTRLFTELSWSDDAVEWANSMWSGTIAPALELRNVGAKPEWVQAVSKTLPDGILPKAYQVAGAIFLATAKGAMLFDQQGTGKMTQTALTLSLYPDAHPCLIVCPKGVVYTWQTELAKFGIESVVVDGGAAERRKQFETFQNSTATVLIISYGLMAKHSRVAGFGTIKLSDDNKAHKEIQQTKWAVVVADECHRLKDPTAVQTRACWAAREGATYVWGLTGTPIESNVMDLWALLHFVSPIEFPSKTKFMSLWVMLAPTFFGTDEVIGLNPLTLTEFREVTEWHWRRVLLSDDLPPAEFDLRYATMDAKHMKTYKDMKKQLMAEVGSDGSYDTLFAANHMVKTGRLKMMASAEIHIDENDRVRMVEPSWKLDAVQDAMKDYEGKPTIYWFDNRDLLHMFERRLEKATPPINYVSIHGDVSALDRNAAIEMFQHGQVDHILITYGAGSEGTTLTRSPVAFRVQRPYSSIQDEQAPFRNRRIGSEAHDQITYVDFVTKDTYDEDQRLALEGKTQSRQEVLCD